MPKALKPVKVGVYNFKEGVDMDAVPYQFNKPVRKTLFTLEGDIVIAAGGAGHISPAVGAAADGTTLWPYLLNLLTFTFDGNRIDTGKGLKMNGVPAWVLWMEGFIARGIAPVVDDGGMAAASFVAGTYHVKVQVPLAHFDPKTPASQHPFTYFRPVCYNKQPKITISCGTLFQAGYAGNRDDVALSGDLATAILPYTLSNMKVTVTAYLVPDLPMAKGDPCGDRSYEYKLLPGLSASAYNNINLSDLGVQHYLTIIETIQNIDVNAVTTEKGIMTLGSANKGIIELLLGTDIVSNPYAANVEADDIEEFMHMEGYWPLGMLMMDLYSHSWTEWQKKTFLAVDNASLLLNAQGTPAVASPTCGGSNFRYIHTSTNLSPSALRSQGKFPPYQGM